METKKFDRSVLKRLSNYGFVVGFTVSLLDSFHYDQVELIANDATAKASWLITQRLYERTGIAAFAVAIGLRLAFWIIEYLQEDRQKTKESNVRTSR